MTTIHKKPSLEEWEAINTVYRYMLFGCDMRTRADFRAFVNAIIEEYPEIKEDNL